MDYIAASYSNLSSTLTFARPCLPTKNNISVLAHLVTDIFAIIRFRTSPGSGNSALEARAWIYFLSTSLGTRMTPNKRHMTTNSD